MRVFELDISWAATASERRHLQWELLGSEDVRGVFLTARDDVLAVLFAGDDAAEGEELEEPGEVALGGLIVGRN